MRMQSLTEDGPILYVGPENAVEGYPTVVEAHSILRQWGASVPLHLVGGSVASRSSEVTRSGRLDGKPLEAAYDSARMVVVPTTCQDRERIFTSAAVGLRIETAYTKTTAS